MPTPGRHIVGSRERGWPGVCCVSSLTSCGRSRALRPSAVRRLGGTRGAVSNACVKSLDQCRREEAFGKRPPRPRATATRVLTGSRLGLGGVGAVPSSRPWVPVEAARVSGLQVTFLECPPPPAHHLPAGSSSHFLLSQQTPECLCGRERWGLQERRPSTVICVQV